MTETERPATLVVGSEVHYAISGNVTDGTTNYTLGGTATMAVEASVVGELHGYMPWNLVFDYAPTFNGVSVGSEHRLRYIAQAQDGAILYFGGESPSGTPILLTGSTDEPALVPSPYASPASWSWSGQYPDLSVMDFAGTLTGPEPVSTPVGTIQAYRVSQTSTINGTPETEIWWMSPTYGLPVRIQIMFAGSGASGTMTLTMQSFRSVP